MPDIKLTDLVASVDQDRLVIPDFQRGFKWKATDIRKLLESLLLDYPIGAALLWRTQRGSLEFRRVEDVQFGEGEDSDVEEHQGAGSSSTEEIDFILDGQQRITSIYKLFPASLAPKDTELDSRLRGLRFFLDLQRLGLPLELEDLARTDYSVLADPDNVSASIIEKTHSELRRDFRQITQGPAAQKLTEENILEICTRRLWLPLSRTFLDNKLSHYQRLIREASYKLNESAEQRSTGKSQAQMRKEIDEGLDRWSNWFWPTFAATLNRKTLTCLILGNDRPEGLARIFETINSTGMSLSVFDLLVARLGAWGIDGARTNLRKVVYECVDRALLKRFDDDRALGGSATQQIPRILALRAGIELKKGEILRAGRERFIPHTSLVGPGLQHALSTLLFRMGVVDDSYVPFKDAITLIGAVYSPETWLNNKAAIECLVWAACLIEDWENTTNDRTRQWYRSLERLVAAQFDKEGLVKRLHKEFPSFDDVRDSASKGSIIFRTLMSFNLARGGRDWAGNQRSPDSILEDHHIFPKDWITNNKDDSTDKQSWWALRDSVLNRIFVSETANRDAKAQTPPKYLSKLSPDERRTLQLPESFMGPLPTPIPYVALSGYLEERYNLMREDFVSYVAAGLRGSRRVGYAFTRRTAGTRLVAGSMFPPVANRGEPPARAAVSLSNAPSSNRARIIDTNADP